MTALTVWILSDGRRLAALPGHDPGLVGVISPDPVTDQEWIALVRAGQAPPLPASSNIPGLYEKYVSDPALIFPEPAPPVPELEPVPLSGTDVPPESRDGDR